MGLLYSHYEASPTIKINACSGGIYKTYKESWFERFHLKSSMSENLLCKNPVYSQQNKVVLQMVICGDMEVIAEIIDKKDLEKYFIDKGSGKDVSSKEL